MLEGVVATLGVVEVGLAAEVELADQVFAFCPGMLSSNTNWVLLLPRFGSR